MSTRKVFEAFELPQATKVVRVDDLRLPIHFCLGRYEAANQEEINDLITDLTHELERRDTPRAA